MLLRFVDTTANIEQLEKEFDNTIFSYCRSKNKNVLMDITEHPTKDNSSVMTVEIENN